MHYNRRFVMLQQLIAVDPFWYMAVETSYCAAWHALCRAVTSIASSDTFHLRSIIPLQVGMHCIVRHSQRALEAVRAGRQSRTEWLYLATASTFATVTVQSNLNSHRECPGYIIL